MALPGPFLPAWGAELVLLALVVIVIGEAARSTLARWAGLLRTLEPIERALVDLYLGGAAIYLVAVVPVGAFDPVLVPALLVAAAVASLTWGLHRRDPGRLRSNWHDAVAAVRRPAYLVTFAASLVLLAVELAAVDGLASGNTYDGSLLGLYTGLTNLHHQLPTSLAPVADQALAYPQATTAWLAMAQGLFTLPPIATSLLVTPLFFALAPLGGFVVGRRLVGSESAGAVMALVFALAAPWTRDLVEGSNDFVLAFPLILLLFGWSGEWVRDRVPSIPDALLFGGLLGYGAALNPVGPLWLAFTWPIAAAIVRPRFGSGLRSWAGRWLVTLLTAIPWVLPPLLVTATQRSSSAGGANGPLAPGGHVFGFSSATWVGQVDPFLFRPQDVALSPFPILRVELAVLLVAGVVLLAWGARRVDLAPHFRRLMLGGAIGAVALTLVPAPASVGIPGFVPLAAVTSAAEASDLLFAVYTVVAAVPILVLVRLAASAGAPGPSRSPSGRGDRRRPMFPPAMAILASVVLLLPGAVITTTDLPGYLHGQYERLGNVTTADEDLLTWAAIHLPNGARVLVAPGGAGEFLPSYNPRLVVVFPMTLGFLTGNASYWLVVDELTNGTLDTAGQRALANLDVGYAIVTQANTQLFAPFTPAPFQTLGWPVLFQENDAVLFGAPPPSVVPG